MMTKEAQQPMLKESQAEAELLPTSGNSRKAVPGRVFPYAKEARPSNGCSDVTEGQRALAHSQKYWLPCPEYRHGFPRRTDYGMRERESGESITGHRVI